jgi:hypothetical protein
VSTAAALLAAPYGRGARNCDALATTKGSTVDPQIEASAKPPVPGKIKVKGGPSNGAVNR